MTDRPRVWVARARPGAERTAARLTAMGVEPVVMPLLAIRRIEQAAPDLTDVVALAFTSRNGVAAFAALSPVRDRPILAVGDATAEAARQAGFVDVTSAGGDLADLATLILAHGFAPDAVILSPGAVEPAGDLAAAVGSVPVVRALPVYEAVETRSRPPEDCVAVLVHSPRAGRALARTLTPADARSLTVVAISEAAAVALEGLPFLAVQVADAPNEDRLLATLGKALSRV